MKLLFSEAQPDYGHYIFPYAVWGFPEGEETPAHFFERGFLPSTREMDRFYLCRQVRVRLREFQASSENRRVLRKGEGLTAQLLARNDFEYTTQRREFYKDYAEQRFGPGTMPYSRLDSLFAAKTTSHILLFLSPAGAEVGAVTLYLEGPRMAYYYYGFYDLAYFEKNLGMFMMTAAVKLFAERGFDFLYLGSCYSRNALYKTQFAGAEFFNGVRWSANLDELKYLVDRTDHSCHLLESEDFRARFYEGDLGGLVKASGFRVNTSEPSV